jgi:hypothetical protein
MSKHRKSIRRGEENGGQRGKVVKRQLTEPAAKPVSLRPLSFEEAVRGLAQVKPSAVKRCEPT